MTLPSFEPWPKIPRLYRDIIITEKIDGTNAAVVIEPINDEVPDGVTFGDGGDNQAIVVSGYAVYAQSRKRVIAPGKNTDNHGFARFVRDNASVLVATLGPGRHYGEWCGQGIQSGYGLPDKRLALFNAVRWRLTALPAGVTTVPILYEGPFSEDAIKRSLNLLRVRGSLFGVNHPYAEGIIVYHVQGNLSFKVTLEHDEVPKEHRANSQA